ncbi:MAG: ABC transporter ATP-binding protein [Caldisericum sp.]|jgi:ABC-2 type transport system ATP-binding protein|uniref:ABC transporter ATP-binding protein n=2 Tax=Caldisericaceae TaxID=693073 RepID=UPI003C791FF6
MYKYVIEVNNLKKVYRRQVKEAGLVASIKSIFKPKYEEVEALRGISFNVQSGEIVGYIGPNGAGKTTTLKILAGVLFPTDGEVRVLDENPYKRTKQFLNKISFIMASRGFLEEVAWDIPVSDGFYFVKEIYNIPFDEYRKRVNTLVSMMNIEAILNTPVRNLSHGQRKKAELVANLLWEPRLILLDEPTLGLDIFSQNELHNFLRNYVKDHGATIILTSHSMKDIERCATRVIMIDKGIKLYDGNIEGLKKRICNRKYIKVCIEDEFDNKLDKQIQQIDGVSIISKEENCLTISVEETIAKDIAKRILNQFAVTDITITEPTLEDLVFEIYSKENNNV